MEYLNAKGPKDPERSGQSRLLKLETDLQGLAGWHKLVQAEEESPSGREDHSPKGVQVWSGGSRGLQAV